MRVRNGPTHLGIIWPNPKFGLTRTDFKKEAGAAVAASQRMKTCIHLTVGYKLHFSPVIQSDLLIGPQIYHRIILLNRCHYSAGNSYRAGNSAHRHRHAEHYLQKVLWQLLSWFIIHRLEQNVTSGAQQMWCCHVHASPTSSFGERSLLCCMYSPRDSHFHGTLLEISAPSSKKCCVT